MRLIPGKTKVRLELFKGIGLADIIIALIGVAIAALVTASSLPFRWGIAFIVVCIFGFLLVRINDEPLYIFIWHMLRFLAYPRRFDRVYDDKALVLMAKKNRKELVDAFYGDGKEDEKTGSKKRGRRKKKSKKDSEGLEAAADETADVTEEDGSGEGAEAYEAASKLRRTYLESDDEDSDEDEFEEAIEEAKAAEAAEKAEKKAEQKSLKEIIKEENKILKSKTATEEEKNAVWKARAERTAERKKNKAKGKEENTDYTDISDFIPFTAIKEDRIEYNGEYYGTVIEIDPVEFRFFSKYRRDNAIEACFGKVLRGLTGDYGANIVKIQRPIIYDDYLQAEFEKLDQLKLSYESGLLSEEELQSRVEIQYERITEIDGLCNENQVIEGFYYVVLFENDKRRLDTLTASAIETLEQGELKVRRLSTRELAVFLKYTNALDFDEEQVDEIAEENLAMWAMPQRLKFTPRKIEVNKIITHNLRVINYPSAVDDAWLAGVMSFPATKVVVKATPMDRGKAIRAIDRSLAELRGRYNATSIDSRRIELEAHIDTLSSLLVTLQQDNETLLSVNIYITAYDAQMTSEDPLLKEGFSSKVPKIPEMKRAVRHSWGEAGMKLTGMDFLQAQAFIGSQISAYDPMVKEARGIPSNTIAGMYPWIFAHVSDEGGVKLGSSDGIPVFVNFFRRDAERVNSNMVIVGKSGSGKSYTTKSLLLNLAAEDSKIFILDPENEYSELANTLHGKIINVGNATYGRLNPFHIITALDDDEAGEGGGGPAGSFATHLQFLEEFFRQILPDIDKDALEYLNSLVERVYMNFGITAETELSSLRAEDYPVFDDLYDVVLSEFERTSNDYLRQLLRSLVNYISKFSTGGRNSNIWNGPSTITTDENFSVFNFQSLLANRNSTIANAQMLLVLKYIDNEIIKNRDYNIKYGLKRKVVVVIDEAHVFIDTKFPVALDFMFQLAKRIRKYNGMQIVITQNIKDFVGSEEIARKSTAIINACQYSFVFGLAPNDMEDLCRLYEKAGGINEQEQEDIISAKRGQTFAIMSPTSRTSFHVDVPESFVEMFEMKEYVSHYFNGEDGAETWEEYIKDSRKEHDSNLGDRKTREAQPTKEREVRSRLNFSEVTEDEYERGEEGAEADTAEELEEHAHKRAGAVDRMFAAEDALKRKDREIEALRFGGIGFSEEYEGMDEDSYGSIRFDEVDEVDGALSSDERKSKGSGLGGMDFGGIHLEEVDESETDVSSAAASKAGAPADSRMGDDPGRGRFESNAPASVLAHAAEARAQRTAVTSHRKSAAGEEPLTAAALEETLAQFRASLRADMEQELLEKLKWITVGMNLGGGAGAVGAVPGAGVVGTEALTGAVGTVNEYDSDFADEDYADAGSEDEFTDDEFTDNRSEDDFEEDEFTDEDSEEDEFAEDDFTDEDSDEDEFAEDDFSDDDQEEDEYSDDDLEDDEFVDDDLGEDEFDEDESDEDEFAEDEFDEDDFDDEEFSDMRDEEFDEDDELDEDDDLDSDLDLEDDDFDLGDDFGFGDDSEDTDEDDYEPTPFLFAELLEEAAEEYANLGLMERLDEMGEDVMEITVEELGEFIKNEAKKNRGA